MSTPTAINEEYDVVIAGDEPSESLTSQSSFLPDFILLTTWASECDRRHCRVLVAGRLAAADANLRILLLEAGPTTNRNNNPTHTELVNFLNHLAPGSRTIRVYVSRPSSALVVALRPYQSCHGRSGRHLLYGYDYDSKR